MSCWSIFINCALPLCWGESRRMFGFFLCFAERIGLFGWSSTLLRMNPDFGINADLLIYDMIWTAVPLPDPVFLIGASANLTWCQKVIIKSSWWLASCALVWDELWPQRFGLDLPSTRVLSRRCQHDPDGISRKILVAHTNPNYPIPIDLFWPVLVLLQLPRDLGHGRWRRNSG